MSESSRNEILMRIRDGLCGTETVYSEEGKPSSKPITENFRGPEDIQDTYNTKILVDRLVREIKDVKASAEIVDKRNEIRNFLAGFSEKRGTQSFSIWESALLKALGIKKFLQGRGLKVANPVSKDEIAVADFGVTEADYAVAESGTLVLLTDSSQPRSVSLIPPIHIAILKPERIVENLFALFRKLEIPLEDTHEITSCMTFITGPSRTADIELNLTLGVHGPGELIVLVLRDEFEVDVSS